MCAVGSVARSTVYVRVVWIRVGLSVTTVERWEERKGRDAVVVDREKGNRKRCYAFGRSELGSRTKRRNPKKIIVRRRQETREGEEHQKKIIILAVHFTA